MGLNVTGGPIADINSDLCELNVTSRDEKLPIMLCFYSRTKNVEFPDRGCNQITSTSRIVSNNGGYYLPDLTMKLNFSRTPYCLCNN